MEHPTLSRIEEFGKRLIDQDRARVIVEPQRTGTGHWFGGGNLVEDRDGTLWLVGRYRNQGDSRTGLGAGERGLELALFRSTNRGNSFSKVGRWSKADFNVNGHEVLSIEGSALRTTKHGIQLFISTEKSGIGYPHEVESYLKPGTGVWSIDRLTADSFDALFDAEVTPCLSGADPRFVHIKDPFLGPVGDHECLWFCSHPFSWTSSNTGYVRIDSRGNVIDKPVYDAFPRGFTWDVAISRGTSILRLNFCGETNDLLFYDGGECVRNLDEHVAAVPRPRGYSCEELGGLAFYGEQEKNTVNRVSLTQPLFVSPHGTGCSRYVDVLETSDGYYATWQQAQADGSQPLVMNHVSHEDVADLLA